MLLVKFKKYDSPQQKDDFYCFDKQNCVGLSD